MTVFNLPDLGEGLPDAEIREWLVNEGDHVNEDQPIVSMETAKAVVEVPSPFTGKILTLHGSPGDVVKTGAPLVSFESDEKVPAEKPKDAGTVVGNIEVGDNVLQESATGIKPRASEKSGIKATPAVRKLARSLNIDLSTITGTGPHGSITRQDIESASSAPAQSAEDFENLHGVERFMGIAMSNAHKEVPPITIVDDADIQHFTKDDNITLRLIRAVCAACDVEPKLNAHFDGKNMSRKLFDNINLAIAVDTPAGLYAPVIKDAKNKSDTELREKINQFKEQAKAQEFPPEDLKDATITLSNFGVFVGRYASAMVVPPTVAIIAVGKLRQQVVAVDNQPAVHRMLPISLTVDHRAITGGEAARFLAALIADLQK